MLEASVRAVNAMDFTGKDALLEALHSDRAAFSQLVGRSEEEWTRETPCEGWQIRDLVGHMVHNSEDYLERFEGARAGKTFPDPVGLLVMAELEDKGARRFRDMPRDELLGRLSSRSDRLFGIFERLDENQWGSEVVNHAYMGPLPAFFYPIFQLVDYALHTWDIREGRGINHGLGGDSADLLVPLNFIVWSATHTCTPDTEPFEIGIRVTGRNGGDTKMSCGPEGVAFETGDISGCPATLEFDPATLTLTAYQRMNGGTSRGDPVLVERFLNLFFKI